MIPRTDDYGLERKAKLLVLYDQKGGKLKIIQATIEHLDEVTALFDKYRQFYDQIPDYDRCREFIHQRITNDESVIFIAQKSTGEIVGFTQLYKSFCSIELKELIYLYDLFVDPSARRIGVAKALMETAKTYAKECNAARLTLDTAITNTSAQSLYETMGYEKDEEFYTYHLTL